MDITKKNKESYESFNYFSKSYEQSNPHRLKFVMNLLGFKTADLDTARVLEIGCSFGGNIVPFAVGHENAEVHGIDLSENQIEMGMRIIEKMEFENIKLHTMNILDYKGELGKFDYIICHGVYSWVPDVVKEKILDVIKESLSENGVAHISYNVYPGWKYLEPYREMMFFRKELMDSKNIKLNERETVAIGRGMAEFLSESLHLDELIKDKKDVVIDGQDYYIYHEYFEETNDPVYLYDFNESLEKRGLCYVGDSNIVNCLIPADLKEVLDDECGNDMVAKEQYVDFVQNRQFRNSLITHAENKSKIKNANELLFSDFMKYYLKPKYLGQEFENMPEFEKLINENKEKGIQVEKILELNAVDNNALINMIVNNKLQVESEEIELKMVEKPKLKERYKRYFETVGILDNPPITIACKKGLVVSPSGIEIRFMTYFNGERTTDDVYNLVKKEYENGEITINVDEGKDLDEVIKEYVGRIKEFIIFNGFCE